MSDLTSIAIRKAPVARFMVNRFMSLPQKYGYRLGGEKTGKFGLDLFEFERMKKYD